MTRYIHLVQSRLYREVKKRRKKPVVHKPVGDSLGILDRRVYSHYVARDNACAILLRSLYIFICLRNIWRFFLFPPDYFFSFRFNCKRFVAFWLEAIRSSQAQRLAKMKYSSLFTHIAAWSRRCKRSSSAGATVFLHS